MGPVIRLFAAGPTCRTLGFNVANDTALWINVCTLLEKNLDERATVAGLVDVAMHQLAHACTPYKGHGRVWSVAQSFANQMFFDVCTTEGLLQCI